MIRKLRLFLIPLVVLIQIFSFPFNAGTEFIHQYIVVVDPGHGGIDPGCIGYSGTEEKEINLSVARLVSQLSVNEPGLKVILTRNSDQYIDPNDRVRYANRKKADIFVSIHANAHDNVNVKGIETFIAEKLNHYQINRSRELARLIQNNLAYRTTTRDRGVRQAPLFIRKAYMPAVLVEMGFITNRYEERSLKGEVYQEKIAEGIFEGIKEYFGIYNY